MVYPLAQPVMGVACTVCDKPQSVWGLVHGAANANQVCSWCLLYKSRWGVGEGVAIEAFIAAVEEAMNVKFERSATGELLHCADADRLMMALVLEDKVFARRR